MDIQDSLYETISVPRTVNVNVNLTQHNLVYAQFVAKEMDTHRWTVVSVPSGIHPRTWTVSSRVERCSMRGCEDESRRETDTGARLSQNHTKR